MHLQSLGVRTEVMFAEELVDRGDYLVARTPSNPTFFWGNILVFAEPPRLQDLTHGGSWMMAFEREFPSCKHRSFIWDRVEGEELERAGFERLGFMLDETVLFRVAPPADEERIPVDVRSIGGEWAAVFELLDLCFTPGGVRAEGYRNFLRLLLKRYETLVAAGRGHWLGVFRGGELVGTCGVFEHEGLARFQLVAVHPGHRRQGLGAALVAEVSRFARREWPAAQILIGASPGTDAERIYRRLGFEPIERVVGLILGSDAGPQ